MAPPTSPHPFPLKQRSLLTAPLPPRFLSCLGGRGESLLPARPRIFVECWFGLQLLQCSAHIINQDWRKLAFCASMLGHIPYRIHSCFNT